MRKEISPEKLLDMTRSILPSKARKRARKQKAIVKRSTRRSVRQDVDHYDEDSKIDLKRDPSMRWIVFSRQSADKLNHFMRWCEALTRGMPKQRKLEYVRALLPNTIVGDHAYLHWEQHCNRRRSPFTKDSMARLQQSRLDRTRRALRIAVEKDPSLIGEINAVIKARKVEGEARRLLYGMHDIDAFVREILHRPWCYIHEKRVLESIRVLD